MFTALFEQDYHCIFSMHSAFVVGGLNAKSALFGYLSTGPKRKDVGGSGGRIFLYVLEY